MRARQTLFLLLPLVVAAACDSQTPTPAEAPAHSHANYALTPELHKTIAELRQRYGRYHNPDKAVGWINVGCVSDPVLGGMGDHYSRYTLDDPRVRGDDHVDLAEDPDFLVYAPQKNGKTKLAALDYTIPLALWTEEDPPELFDIPFRRNDAFGVWMFHIWLFDPNPAGIFQDFNPDVLQCAEE
jgi:hypothetical protein